MSEFCEDDVIGAVADGEPISMRAIQRKLGIEHVGKLSSMLSELTRGEQIKRESGRYVLNTGKYENPGRSLQTRKERLPTDKAAVVAKEKRKAKMNNSEAVSIPPKLSGSYPITSLEDAEQAADTIKERDQRIRDAVQRLKVKANFKVDPVDRLEFKIEILDGLGSSDPDLWDVLKDVIADLRRLDELSLGPF